LLRNSGGVTLVSDLGPVDRRLDPPSGICRDFENYSVLTTVILAIVIGLVAVVTIAGNTLVVAAFATDRKLRSFGNYFILNLAISDLIVGLLICFYAPYLLRGCWQLTRAGCLVFIFLDYVVPLASAWNMALISLDRYWSVARPIDYRLRLNTRRAVPLMTVPWLAGTVWYGPTVLFWERFTGRPADQGEGRASCKVTETAITGGRVVSDTFKQHRRHSIPILDPNQFLVGHAFADF
jgi:hypothetical protein